RNFLIGGALSLLGPAAGGALAGVTVSPQRDGPPGDVLVTIFLRGGADSLSVVVPHGDDDYYRNRPTLAVPHPHDAKAKPQERAIDLDGYFGLHPALSSLQPLHEAGQLAIVHACGSGDQTRSHFEAMATVERGVDRDTGPASGWLARHLISTPWENRSPLRAVALGAMVPETLRGAASAIALETVADLELKIPFKGREGALDGALHYLYSPTGGDDPGGLRGAGQEALSVLKTLQALTPASGKPAAGYPKDDLGEGLRQVALLIKSGVGLEAACLDHGSFDTHVAQAPLIASRLTSLGGGLAAFAADLGPDRWARTSVVVLSEFGRRVEENSGAGTDHGRAGMMMVLGGGVVGHQVHGHWPGLAPANLEGPGDLKVTTDYRSVLAEVIRVRLRNPNIQSIFPGLAAGAVGVVRA
ncbi:MAG: DUF1501 domain-containing protein, partial [Armatimonadota bacterium]|nr:DUF1501 domain-containing protein [Armatimonadota bacterium]